MSLPTVPTEAAFQETAQCAPSDDLLCCCTNFVLEYLEGLLSIMGIMPQ